MFMLYYVDPTLPVDFPLCVAGIEGQAAVKGVDLVGEAHLGRTAGSG